MASATLPPPSQSSMVRWSLITVEKNQQEALVYWSVSREEDQSMLRLGVFSPSNLTHPLIASSRARSQILLLERKKNIV